MPKVAGRKTNLEVQGPTRGKQDMQCQWKAVERLKLRGATRVSLQHGRPAKQLQLLADRCTHCILRAASPGFKPDSSPGLGVTLPITSDTAGPTVCTAADLTKHAKV